MFKERTTVKELKDLSKKMNIETPYFVMRSNLLSVPSDEKNIVINLANSAQHGTHWLALYNDDALYYFDSFGLEPPNEVVEYAEKINKPLYYSNNQYQNLDQGRCGQFVLLFFYSRENNIDLNKWLKPIRKFKSIQ